MEEIRNEVKEIQKPAAAPEKEEYIRKINELSAVDQAFLDGYLFAKVTERKKGA